MSYGVSDHIIVYCLSELFCGIRVNRRMVEVLDSQAHTPIGHRSCVGGEK